MREPFFIDPGGEGDDSKDDAPIEGEHYFIARCPETNQVISWEHDPSRGTNRGIYGSAGETIITCGHCQVAHTFDNSEIESVIAKAK